MSHRPRLVPFIALLASVFANAAPADAVSDSAVDLATPDNTPSVTVARHQTATMVESTESRLGLGRLDMGTTGLLVSEQVRTATEPGVLGKGILIVGDGKSTLVVEIDESTSLQQLAEKIDARSFLNARVIADMDGYRMYVAFNNETTTILNDLEPFDSTWSSEIVASLTL